MEESSLPKNTARNKQGSKEGWNITLNMKETEKQIVKLCIKIAGEEWTGKSSAANTIMGQPVFQVDRDSEVASQSSGVIEGRNVTVVDTPGWDSQCSSAEPLKILTKAYVSESVKCQGIDVLLLTIPISQDQKWNLKVAQRLSNALQLFNDEIWKHTMLLFTRADQLNSSGFEGYLEGSGQPFHSLMEKCDRRYHVINNRNKKDRKQIRELLEKVERMVWENDGYLLQFITEEKIVTEHEMETPEHNEQFEERYAEEHHEETHFKLEDYMFKSLPPGGNVSPASEMEHPVDMQDGGLEPTVESDWSSESPAEENRDLAVNGGGDDGDTETSDGDQNAMNICTEVEQPDDEDKNQHLQGLTLQWNTFVIRDISWDLIITYSFYSTASNHEQTAGVWVLQVNICWRHLEPPCQTDWISFTVCDDGITQLFITVLYMFRRYLDLVYKTYKVPKETGDQIINTSVHGFLEHQEVQDTFHSLLWQNAYNWNKSLDEEITQCRKVEEDDGETPRQNTRGADKDLKQCGDVVLPEDVQKGEENEEENPKQSAKGKDKPLPQHIHQGEEGKDEELTQHTTPNKELLQSIHEMIKTDVDLPHHGQEPPQNFDQVNEVERYQQIKTTDKHPPNWKKRGDTKEIPRHKCKKDDKKRLQQRKKVGDDHTLQRSVKKDEKQMMDHQRNTNESGEMRHPAETDDDRSINSNIHGDGGWGQLEYVNNSADARVKNRGIRRTRSLERLINYKREYGYLQSR